MDDKVVINKEQCKLIAERLMPLELRPGHFKRPYLTFTSDNETKLRAWFYSTAICHQTHTLINRKRNLKGWDYLEYVFTNLGKEKSKLIDPTYLTTLQVGELIERLKPLFADDESPEHCTLDRLEQRAQFIIDISKKINEDYDGKIGNMLKKCNGFLFKDGTGLYELLKPFPSFDDPLRKKSTLFIQLIIDTDMIKFKDKENLVPVMDYHMQRVLLRTGCIEVLDNELKEALLLKKTLKSDQEVRNASVKAIRIISKLSNKNISIIHDFFWPLGRSCCKEKTLCTDRTCNKDPCTFFLFVNIPKHNRCSFEGICKGNNDETYRLFWQPIVDTHYY
ncbi:hypothetical protein HYX12_01385 [Candidatus Woesearchaeota archaeon]|nr:hypothetical protein [Candidatus Woesearchaeota archaeon]